MGASSVPAGCSLRVELVIGMFWDEPVTRCSVPSPTIIRGRYHWPKKKPRRSGAGGPVCPLLHKVREKNSEQRTSPKSNLLFLHYFQYSMYTSAPSGLKNVPHEALQGASMKAEPADNRCPTVALATSEDSLFVSARNRTVPEFTVNDHVPFWWAVASAGLTAVAPATTLSTSSPSLS